MILETLWPHFLFPFLVDEFLLIKFLLFSSLATSLFEAGEDWNEGPH